MAKNLHNDPKKRKKLTDVGHLVICQALLPFFAGVNPTIIVMVIIGNVF